MAHALKTNGSFSEWNGRSFRDANGILHQPNIASLWTEAERKAVGLYPIVEGSIPEGKVSTGSDLEYDEATDTVARVHTLADKPPPTPADVNAERDRRLNNGVTVNVTGYGDIPIQGREADRINVLALKDTARDLIAAGVTVATKHSEFRDANNVVHELTPAQVIELSDKGKAAAASIIRVAWDMKDGTGDFTGGIPSDYTDDKHWP